MHTISYLIFLFSSLISLSHVVMSTSYLKYAFSLSEKHSCQSVAMQLAYDLSDILRQGLDAHLLMLITR